MNEVQQREVSRVSRPIFPVRDRYASTFRRPRDPESVHWPVTYGERRHGSADSGPNTHYASGQRWC